jgi:hypothetical protein
VLHFQLETCQQALVNGIRKRIKFMHRNAIDCEVLTGTARIKMNFDSTYKFNKHSKKLEFY